MHTLGRLERDTASIKGDTFANKGHAFTCVLRSATIAQDDEFRWLATTLGHGK